MDTAQRIKRILRAKLYTLVDANRGAAAAGWDFIESVEDIASVETAAVDPKGTRYLSVLELPRTASREQIKAAYKRLCKRYHPDHFAGDAAKMKVATELLTEINAAYAYLMRKRVGSA